MTTCDDAECEEEDEIPFPNDPRGSSLQAPVSKMVTASGEGGEDEEFKAAVACETFAATSPRPVAPRKPTRETSSAVLRASSAQTNDDQGRADLALSRASEMSLARQAVFDDGPK